MKRGVGETCVLACVSAVGKNRLYRNRPPPSPPSSSSPPPTSSSSSSLPYLPFHSFADLSFHPRQVSSKPRYVIQSSLYTYIQTRLYACLRVHRCRGCMYTYVGSRHHGRLPIWHWVPTRASLVSFLFLPFLTWLPTDPEEPCTPSSLRRRWNFANVSRIASFPIRGNSRIYCISDSRGYPAVKGTWLSETLTYI